MAPRAMVGNYAAITTAWRLLCEFAGLPEEFENFPHHLLAEMNAHNAATKN